jgi:hypothetical protein
MKLVKWGNEGEKKTGISYLLTMSVPTLVKKVPFYKNDCFG